METRLVSGDHQSCCLLLAHPLNWGPRSHNYGCGEHKYKYKCVRTIVLFATVCEHFVKCAGVSNVVQHVGEGVCKHINAHLPIWSANRLALSRVSTEELLVPM